ncbi:MAG: GH92 family glycosyl hydrolase [Armatimonadetes bacterium]|nr:GH92 family glycosyl hydrolase [Armatimonadota bacterium]
MKIVTIIAAIIAMSSLAVGRSIAEPLVDYVNPFIGTTNGGNMFPGASAPFGMVQFSPDTRAPSVGYDYNDHQIQGFSLTHMSGVGCTDYGDVFLTATTGPIETNDVSDYESGFSHSTEAASPGYYRVRLDRWGVGVRLTATTRAGMAEFRFPAGRTGNILVPISHTLTRTLVSRIKIVNSTTIDGSVTSQDFCGAPSHYTVYFVMQFNQPFQHQQVWGHGNASVTGNSAVQNNEVGDVGAAVSWNCPQPRTIIVRIGISYVDIAGAVKNLHHDIKGWNFNQVRLATLHRWDNALGVIKVQGGDHQTLTKFYTSLYHVLLMPNTYSDVDGRYLGFDDKIHHVAPGHIIYANFSGWDIYRTEVPLLALIEPRRLEDMCQSIVKMYQYGGWIDRWPQDNTYTNVMCGSPLTTAMVTAWTAGLHRFDIHTAYQGMWKDATEPAPPGHPYAGETGITYLNRLGYIPYNRIGYGAVSQTEEDCYAYSALALLSSELGNSGNARIMAHRALLYRNLFDPKTGFIRPKAANGSWLSPFNPNSGHGYVEGSGWEYLWFVPQDVAGLIHLLGGDKPFNAKLDEFFNGHHYDPSNEPDLQAPFLYDYSGEPWKTQALVRALVSSAYHNNPAGLPGNDDCGTMSAWYIFSAIGFYPTDPARDDYELVSPIFSQVEMRVGLNRHRMIVTAYNVSKRDRYIEKVSLNGKAWERPWISLKDIEDRGRLYYRLGHNPNKSWGVSEKVRPPSLSTSGV